MFKPNKRLTLVLIIIILSLSFTVTAAAEFGDNKGFDNNRPYFIHDTLIKLIFLLIFTVLALYIFYKRHSWRRYLLILSVVVLGFYLQGFLCPLSAVQNIFTKYNTGYLLLFLIPVISALFFGRIFCGYICPFGAVQELIYIPKLHLDIPDSLRSFLNKIKYILLLYLVIRIMITNEVILSGYTPFKNLFTLGGTRGSIIITVLTVLLSLMIFRPFCRFFCPLGAFLGLLSSFKKNKIIPDSNCVDCGKCTDECPVAAVKNNKINMKECINCCQCFDSCPFTKDKFVD